MRPKPNYWFTLAFALLIILFSCKKEKNELTYDYRNKYTGSYLFTHLSYIRYNFFWRDPPQQKIISDTVEYVGVIEKCDSFRLKIVFGPDNSEPEISNTTFPLIINGLIYPTVI
jgi:hypothetical protein